MLFIKTISYVSNTNFRVFKKGFLMSNKITIIYFCILVLYQTTLHPILRFDSHLISEQEYKELIEESKKEEQPSQLENDIRSPRAIKPFTFMVFIAADNDLHYFAWKNIKQMEQIGSNDKINIVVQLNTPGHMNPTKRYLIKKGSRVLLQEQEPLNHKVNSGNPQTLVDFVGWATKYYPAQDYALIVWNHATGAIDPGYVKTINPCELFYYNPSNKMLEIDRGLTYLSLIMQYTSDKGMLPKRGICFDETFKSYINNQEFEFALHEIYTKILQGKKLSILAFDACLMSMIEIATIAKKYVQYMVGSQEVEYGTGWDYELALKPFLSKALPPADFAKHMVQAYEQAYYKITNEYTQSAIDLSLCDALEANISTVSNLLLQAFQTTNYAQTANILRKCKSTQYCTCFDEPSYIDLGHFYKNLLEHLQYLSIVDPVLKKELLEKLQQALTQGLFIIANCVIANKMGSKQAGAHGLSIYFPEHVLSQSYLKSTFALTNSWKALLSKYIFG